MRLNTILLAGALAFGANAVCSAVDVHKTTPGQDAYNKAVEDVSKGKEQLTAARDEAAKADSEASKVVNQLKQEFEASDEFKTAQANLKQAQSDLEAAKAPVLKSLQNKPDYIAAKTAKAKVDALNAAVNSKEDAKPEDKATSAQSVLNAAGVLSKLEADAITEDVPTSKARQKLLETSNKVTSLTRDFEASIKTNATWTAAKKTQEEAHKKVTDAETAYATAQKTQSAAYLTWQNEKKTADKNHTAVNSKPNPR